VSGESAVGVASGGSSARKRQFRWLFDPRLVTTALASVAVVIVAGLAQDCFAERHPDGQETHPTLDGWRRPMNDQ
jgi:hypothetical protein